MVGKSAVLLTDAKSRNSHWEAMLILFRMWLGALARLRLRQRAAPKKKRNKQARFSLYRQGRMECKERSGYLCCIDILKKLTPKPLLLTVAKVEGGIGVRR